VVQAIYYKTGTPCLKIVAFFTKYFSIGRGVKIRNRWFRQPNKSFPFPSLLNAFFFTNETDYFIGVRKKNVFGCKRKDVATDVTESHAGEICVACILTFKTQW